MQPSVYEADVVGGSEVTMLGKKTGLLLRFSSPSLRDYPSELKDPQGFWSYDQSLFHDARIQHPPHQTR